MVGTKWKGDVEGEGRLRGGREEVGEGERGGGWWWRVDWWWIKLG